MNRHAYATCLTSVFLLYLAVAPTSAAGRLYWEANEFAESLFLNEWYKR